MSQAVTSKLRFVTLTFFLKIIIQIINMNQAVTSKFRFVTLIFFKNYFKIL